MLIFVLFVIKSPWLLQPHLEQVYDYGPLPNTGIQCLLGNINYNHKQNAKKEVINLFRTDLYFQLLQYNTYLVTISFIHNINYWWLDQGRRYLGWRLLIRNNIFTDIGLGCFWKSSSNNGLQPSWARMGFMVRHLARHEGPATAPTFVCQALAGTPARIAHIKDAN